MVYIFVGARRSAAAQVRATPDFRPRASSGRAPHSQLNPQATIGEAGVRGSVAPDHGPVDPAQPDAGESVFRPAKHHALVLRGPPFAG